MNVVKPSDNNLGIKNGIDFALYRMQKSKDEAQMDIIGPYYQTYKTDKEEIKNFYFRVFFTGDKDDIIDRLKNNNTSVFIIGYVYGEYIKEFDQHKLLYSSHFISKEKKQEGKYYVVPINLIKDCKQLEEEIF